MRSLSLAALVALVCSAATPAGAAAQPFFRIGFFDDLFGSRAPDVRAALLDKAKDEDSSIIRLDPSWASIAPAKPARDFDPEDPDDPGYNWTSTDAAVRDASSRGLRIVFTLDGAPRWAQGDDRPSSGDNTNWKVDDDELARFAHAAAERYSGDHPDPLASGTDLPAIHDWQVWNEPNLDNHLTPQWTRDVNGNLRPYSPILYRRMLNGAYRQLKDVDDDNRVIAAGTSPFGDTDPDAGRIQPVAFWRQLLCLGVSDDGCDHLPHFDVADHHPYSVRGPFAAALNADDASVPDVHKITALLSRAVAQRKALPNKHKSMWVTEVSWDSSPPDPDGVPERQQARWLAQTLYELWRQDVAVVTWYQMVDAKPDPSYGATYQSGVFFVDGRPKRSARVFQFPLVLHDGRVWGMAPDADGGTVQIQRKDGGGWKTVLTLTPRDDRVFTQRTSLQGTIRARQGDVVSLPYGA